MFALHLNSISAANIRPYLFGRLQNKFFLGLRWHHLRAGTRVDCRRRFCARLQDKRYMQESG